MFANRKHIRQLERLYVEVTHNCGCVDVVRSRDVGKVIEHDPSMVIWHNFCVAIFLYILRLRKQAKLYEFLIIYPWRLRMLLVTKIIILNCSKKMLIHLLILHN